MDYYEILGVSRNATIEEINKAYRALALQFHPDRHQDPAVAAKAAEKFKQVTLAFDTLRDVNKRAVYNGQNPAKKATKSTPKYKNMTAEERYRYMMEKDPNLQSNTIRAGVPPKYDIWGRPLSREQQQQWLRDYSEEIIPKYYSPVQKPKPRYTKPKSHFVDVFEKYYEKDIPPNLNR